MKRAISLLLALVMILSLCACGGDNGAAQKKEQEKLDRQEIFDMLIEINSISDYCSDAILLMWNNTVHSEVDAANFSTCYSAVRVLNLDISKAEYDDLMGQNVYATIWGAALAIAPDKVTGSNHNQMSDEAQEEVIDLCYYYNSETERMNNLLDDVLELIKTYKENYADDYDEEYSLIYDWYIDSKTYVDFASSPTGSYATYSSQQSDYQATIATYQTKAELL